MRRRAVAALAVGALVGSLMGAVALAPAHAATTTVNCPSGNLQNAINAAAAGSNVYVTGTCTGVFTIPKNLTLIGPATLDGGGSGPVVLVPAGVTAKLSSLTIQNGNSTFLFRDDNTLFGGAGGITNGGNLTLAGTTVTNNHSSGNQTSTQSSNQSCTSNCSVTTSDSSLGLAGAGIYNSGILTLTSSTVSNNTASGTGDLTQDMSGSCVDNCTVSITHVLLGNAGGGIVNDGGTVNLTSSTVSGNTATGNGTLTMSQSASCTSNCQVAIVGSQIADAGGGIVNHAGTLNISSSTVSGNTTSATATFNVSQTASCGAGPACQTSDVSTSVQGGAGIFNDGNLNVTSSSILSNTSNKDGGGIYNAFGFVFIGGAAPAAVVKSSNISNNTASGSGGGIMNFGNLTAKSNSITGNTAGNSGGGIFNGGSITQSSNTFSGNTPDNCNGC